MGVYGHLPFEKWQDRYHTEATIDVAKFIDKKYYGTLLKLGVKRIDADEVNLIVKELKKIDESAFVNILRTESIEGTFYKRPTE